MAQGKLLQLWQIEPPGKGLLTSKDAQSKLSAHDRREKCANRHIRPNALSSCV